MGRNPCVVCCVRPSPPPKKKSSLYPLSPTLTGSLWVPRCNAAPSTRWGRFTDAGTAQGNARRSPSLVSRVSPPPKKKNTPNWISGSLRKRRMVSPHLSLGPPGAVNTSLGLALATGDTGALVSMVGGLG